MSPRKIVLLFFVLAGLLLAGTVIAVVVAPAYLLGFGHGTSGCRASAIPGGSSPLASMGDVVVSRDGAQWKAERVSTYTFPAAERGSVRACTGTGKVVLAVGNPGQVLVEATVVGRGGSQAEARNALDTLHPEITGAGGRVAAWEPSHAWSILGPRADLSFRVTVPATMLVDADLDAGTGDIVVDGPRLSSLNADAGTGGIRLDPSWVEGTLDLSAGTGSIHGRFPAVGASTWDVSAGTGSVTLQLQSDARHGYHVDASAGVGGVRVDLPGFSPSREEHRHFGPGAEVSGATVGYDNADVKVRLDVSTGTGSIQVSSS